uniref:W2 domain-containing protein n=1 Tax=Oryza punctata TaxID=4537 RepID=A0A0E0JVJ3_ORYPU
MELQNIGASNKGDAFYRYKMPKMITRIESRGNGIKTKIVNMVDIAKALARPASYITKYFSCVVGTRHTFDEKTGDSLVYGAHDTVKLAGLLENFIKKYVQCYGCGNPETEIVVSVISKADKKVSLKCAACGHVSEVVDKKNDQFIKFISKGSPEPKKGGKDNKAMRRAEKERMSEGVSNGHGANKATLYDQLVKKIKAKAATPAQVKAILSSSPLPPQDAMNALLDALFHGAGKGFAKEVLKRKDYLAAAVSDDTDAQVLLLHAIEAFCGGGSGAEAVKEVPVVLKVLYDGDVLEEEAIDKWYKEAVAVGRTSPALEKATPFVEWLKRADSEEEEE